MGCPNMIPISTDNLVNSVGEKKKMKNQSSLKISQSSYQRLLRHLGCLTRFFMCEPVVFTLCIHSLIHLGK